MNAPALAERLAIERLDPGSHAWREITKALLRHPPATDTFVPAGRLAALALIGLKERSE